MAKRAWLVRPDHEVQTFGEDERGELVLGDPLAAVSPQALQQAVLEGVVMMERAGGVLCVTSNRAATGIPNERVTTAAMVEWKDRTDARAQPESDAEVIELHAGEGVEEAVLRAVDAVDAEPEEASPVEVDEADVPVHLRVS
jgi:hypothetical protein